VSYVVHSCYSDELLEIDEAKLNMFLNIMMIACSLDTGFFCLFVAEIISRFGKTTQDLKPILR
jgi:hypothetical protein